MHKKGDVFLLTGVGTCVLQVWSVEWSIGLCCRNGPGVGMECCCRVVVLCWCEKPSEFCSSRKSSLDFAGQSSGKPVLECNQKISCRPWYWFYSVLKPNSKGLLDTLSGKTTENPHTCPAKLL